MPCSAIALACSAASRTPSRPPCTIGCRVFTRPSIISGKPVRSETSFTAAGAFDRRAGAAGRDQLYAGRGQRLGGLDQAGLVGDRDQRALGNDAVGSGREIRGGGHGAVSFEGFKKENAQASGVMRSRAPRWSPTLDFASHTERRRLRPRAGRGQCGRGRSSGRSSLAQWGRGPALELILPSWGGGSPRTRRDGGGPLSLSSLKVPLSQLR